jgi:hypothetical protein
MGAYKCHTQTKGVAATAFLNAGYGTLTGCLKHSRENFDYCSEAERLIGVERWAVIWTAILMAAHFRALT